MRKQRTTKAGKPVILGREAFAAISAVEGIKSPTTIAGLTLIPGDTPPAPEVIAQALIDLAEAWKQFKGSRMRRRTLILLLHDQSGVGKRDIEKVLAALDDVDGFHLKSTTSRPV